MFKFHPVSSSVQQALAAVAVGAVLSGFSLTLHARSDAPPSQAATHAQAVNDARAASAFQQVPGFYRQQIGSLQVTALLDGVLWLPLETVQGIQPAKVRAMLEENFVTMTPEGIQTPVNAYLVRRGERLMLVDAGSADCFGPATGKLLENLRAAGTTPESITDVLITHAHPDHACGLADAEGKAVYPKATVWLPAEEGNFWLSPDVKAKAPKDHQKYFDMAVKATKPYQESGRLKRFADGDELPPGTRAFKTPGHSPGHVSWLIDGSAGKGEMPASGNAASDGNAGKDEKRASGRRDAGVKEIAASRNSLLVWGDIVHFPAIQFGHPEAWAAFDAQSEMAVQSRLRMMKRAAKAGWWVAGAHLPFPGIGHVAEQGKTWRWIPAEFGPVGQP